MRYSTLEIIGMMLDWRSWRRDGDLICNGRVKLLSGYGLTAWLDQDGPFARSWEANLLTWAITRPFWWILERKMRSTMPTVGPND